MAARFPFNSILSPLPAGGTGHPRQWKRVRRPGIPRRRRTSSQVALGLYALNQVLEESKLSQAYAAKGAGGHAAEGVCASSLQAGRLLRRTADEPVDGGRPGRRE